MLRITLTAIAALGLTLGCASTDTSERPDEPVVVVDPEPEVVTITKTKVVVTVPDTMAAHCDIETNRAYFMYDSTEIVPSASAHLKSIAECLQHEALADQGIEVLGHADERGSEAYNRDLALDRAEAVRDILVHEGVARARIVTLSKGESQADGETPVGHLMDRKVEIHLMENPSSAAL